MIIEANKEQLTNFLEEIRKNNGFVGLDTFKTCTNLAGNFTFEEPNKLTVEFTKIPLPADLEMIEKEIKDYFITQLVELDVLLDKINK